ncbi:RNA-guided endonuclease TnpB family protein [Campylobacter felis]|uniref:RNA-guided endonuclease InsQ/TnpB family protein n=1 Tax=Campylobacter felis TaxID=2974565 RepID=UPI002563D3C9|nr:RNA-guided endonuclease TnpB family protein [Campylobacter felis]
MQRVERYIIKPNDKRFNSIKEICHKSKNLYNYVNYIIRQDFIANKSIPKEYDLTTKLAKEKQADYISLPAQSSQQTIKLLYKNYKSFFKALKSYQKDKSKFTSNPKLPKYKAKNGVSIVVFTNQQAKIKQGKSLNKIHFPKSTNLKPLITKIDNQTSTLKQVKFIPKSTCFIVEVVYECLVKATNLIENSFLSIDLGLNNFVTSIDNQSKQPFIINGRAIKSVNQFFNKLRAKYTQTLKLSNNKFHSKKLANLALKRDCKINDFIHKSSDFIIKHCIEHKIANIVIGKNKEWKQKINLGKKTNQNFVSIPYSFFIEKMAYKCENYGIKLHLTKESHTSKFINADLNGAIGIARKVFPNAVQTLRDSGTAFVPIKISIGF